MFEPFYEVVFNVSKNITENKTALGRPVIGVMPAFFPMELIDAAGGYPVQLWGNNLSLGKSDAYLQAFSCSVARSVLELELIEGARMVEGYAFTSICDTLINLRELYRRLFPKPTVELSIPITRTDEARRIYLKSVIASVISGLEDITGTKVTSESLTKASSLHARTRELQRQLYYIRAEKSGLIKNYDFYVTIKAGFFLPRSVYNQMLEDLLEKLDKLPQPKGKRTKIVLSGMVFDPIEIYKIFDDLNIDIVDDDFANGWRTVSKGPLEVADIVEGVTSYVFNPAPCCCLYNPDNDRHPYLVDKAKKAGAEGVLFWYIKFCEPDAFDRPQLIQRLKDEGIPASFFDVELSMTNFDAIKTRIDAFSEMIKG
ncbi:MAG: 2-hydroxyacyl-CoA dehydratase [Deltaproteobacteria bacterium]|nr:2-hydroxyacyl-CoA dehydratase [Deltaproteobacteria bacterium]MBW2053711.1 2-hydroxyacyl-CoA dehydratase [Deltaproteobacteria bacterium]MBW2139438.1 2-hydroxyacyl-CoA dehydratase [Deltaproteobacteria bacterium]MBW2323861.1 2-hydroxyacyl-CoA dehydratase [Deltaproteobacteria bacterium]